MVAPGTSILANIKWSKNNIVIQFLRYAYLGMGDIKITGKKVPVMRSPSDFEAKLAATRLIFGVSWWNKN